MAVSIEYCITGIIPLEPMEYTASLPRVGVPGAAAANPVGTPFIFDLLTTISLSLRFDV